MNARQQIDRILREQSEEPDETKSEAIEALIPSCGWLAVLDELLRILRESSSLDDCTTAAEVTWGATLDRRQMPVDRIIALLYHRWPPDPHEDNLAWSITSKLKGVGYLSDEALGHTKLSGSLPRGSFAGDDWLRAVNSACIPWFCAPAN